MAGSAVAGSAVAGSAVARRPRKKLIGVVRSAKQDKTVVVEIVRFFMHKKYKKYVKTRTRYQAHDPENYYMDGDRVEITETRPLSKHKRFVVSKLVAGSAERRLQELEARQSLKGQAAPAT
ncbi:MAG: 30S ribosomal protein S17 [Myxococcota bacterium]